ncbi:MAG: hypothetical protein GY845_19380 [Planctomycetes bacterium]|nr:hypothetical protein [Planctomycetota bacterium]
MRTKMLGLIFAAIAAMMLPFSSGAFAADVVIIANKDVPLSSLSGSDVKKIFLAKKTAWDNGKNIDFVTLQGSDVHKAFLNTYLSKSSSQFRRYFRTLVFTGKCMAPRSFSTEREVVGYVSSTGGAIGYVSAATSTGSAKVLNVN